MDVSEQTTHDATSSTTTPSQAGEEPKAARLSAAGKLWRHASHYSLASLVSVIAGLVTFPLLTRTLSVHDYGLLSLLSATLGIAVTLGKTGLQHAIIRFFAEIAAGRSPFTLKQLHATAIFGMLATGLVVFLALSVGVHLVPDRWLGDERMRGLLAIVAVLAVVEVMDSAVSNFLVADQRSTALLKYQFVRRSLGLLAVVTALLLIAPTLLAFWWAKVIAEGIALLLPLWMLFARQRELRLRLTAFSKSLYRRLLAYGLPMAVGYELSGVILNVGDRYIVNAMIGKTELGLYSAAYSLSQYVHTVFISSVGMAIMPLYMRMWDEEGPEKTTTFVSRSLRNYVLLAAPIIAGLSSVGPELLPALASDRYASASHVIPWVSSALIVDGVASFLGAGLFVHRKANTISLIVFGSAMVNVVLNVLLVPRLGVLGAAVSTLVSYVFLCALFARRGQPLLNIRFPWATACRAAFAAVVMFAGLHYVMPGGRLLTVGVRIAVGAPLYLGLIALIDADARNLTAGIRIRLRERLQSMRSK